MINDSDIADFYLDSIEDYKERCLIYVPYQSEIEMLALKRGFKIIYEVFADRNYNDDLSLVSRDCEFAMINKPKDVIKHIKSIIESNIVKAVSGNTYKIKFDTLCVHSDTNNSIKILKEINRVFKNR
jgi:UPF0271 protein